MLPKWIKSSQEALWNYLPYPQMQCLYTITGQSQLEPNYFAISSDNKTLVSNAHSLISGEEQYENVNFWDLTTGKLIKIAFRHDNMSIGFNGQFLVGIIYTSDVIIVLNLKNNECNFILDSAPRCLTAQKINVNPLAASSDKPIVACGGFVYSPPSEGVITAYDLLLEPLSREENAIRLPVQNLKWKPQRYPSCNTSVLISSDGNIVLSQTVHTRYDSHRLWDLRTGEIIRVFDTSSFWLAEFLAINPNGQAIACGRRLGKVQVWNLYTDEIICSAAWNSPTAMTTDGRVLAYCNVANEIILWDIEKNREICTLPGNASKIERIALSLDRKWIASYSADQTIRIWGVSYHE